MKRKSNDTENATLCKKLQKVERENRILKRSSERERNYYIDKAYEEKEEGKDAVQYWKALYRYQLKLRDDKILQLEKEKEFHRSNFNVLKTYADWATKKIEELKQEEA
jgi:hypothetical protein